MKYSTKAALFSCIVFPGAGYFVVKKTARAIAALLVTLPILLLLMVESFHKAQLIAEQIINGQLAYDINSIREQILLTPGIYSTTLLSVLSFLVGAVWVVGIVDSYRLGLMLDKAGSV